MTSEVLPNPAGDRVLFRYFDGTPVCEGDRCRGESFSYGIVLELVPPALSVTYGYAKDKDRTFPTMLLWVHYDTYGDGRIVLSDFDEGVDLVRRGTVPTEKERERQGLLKCFSEE